MAAQLVLNIAEIEAEEGELIPVEMDSLLLLSDAQVRAEVAKLSPEGKSKI